MNEKNVNTKDTSLKYEPPILEVMLLTININGNEGVGTDNGPIGFNAS